jgi:hypothetical protein
MSNIVPFGKRLEPDSGIGETLIGPRCGFDYLHQGRVTVYDRSEDDELTPVTTVPRRPLRHPSHPLREVRQPVIPAARDWPSPSKARDATANSN